MSIFGWGGETKAELKDKIVCLENKITDFRDEKITSDIELNRVETNARADKESYRGLNQIEIAQLNRQIAVLEADFEDAVDADIAKKTKQNDAELAQAKKTHKAELKAEMGAELDQAKKDAKAAFIESTKNKGFYDGALLVIKALEAQLATSNKLNEILVKQLPEIKANFTTAQGDHSVTVNK